MKKSLSYFFIRERILKEKGEKVLSFTLTSPSFPPPIKRENILKLYPRSFPYSPSVAIFL
jgi:hypothetical protein